MGIFHLFFTICLRLISDELINSIDLIKNHLLSPIIKMTIITFEDYEVLQTLGEGTFGKVKLARKNGQLYAIKFSADSNAYSNQVMQNIFFKESKILKDLNHPNIIKLYQAIVNGNYIQHGVCQKKKNALVFQYAPHNLGGIMELGPLQQPLARALFKQLLEGLSYIHAQNIIHRDIKPENILFDQDFNLKICDFGLSVKIEGCNNKPKTLCGSDLFKSPEMLMKKNYNGLMNDLFAAGVTLFILITGKGPFINANPNCGNYQFIAYNYFEKFWSIYEKKTKLSKNFKNIINSMLAFDPTNRLSISEIMSHPWMCEDTLLGGEIQESMNKKVNKIVESKKISAVKKIKTVNIKKKRHIVGADPSQTIKKEQYNTSRYKLTDRFVPKLENFGHLEHLLADFAVQLEIKEGKIKILKEIEEENIEPEGKKIMIDCKVFSHDQNIDCLRFSLQQGNIYSLHELLEQFDISVFGDESK